MSRNRASDPRFGKANPLSIVMVATNFDVTPIAGGAGRCKEIDEFVYDNYVANQGQIPQGGLSALEADWIASADCLFYVTPRILSCISWTWSEFLTITRANQHLLKSTLDIRFKDPDEAPVVMEMSNSAAQRLLALWQVL